MKCVNAIMEEAYISTVWRRGSLVFFSIVSVTCFGTENSRIWNVSRQKWTRYGI